MKAFFIFCIALWSLTATGQSNFSEQSEVRFSIGNLAVNKVKGSISGMSGTLIFNPAQLDQSSFNVCVDAATIDTGNEKRDDHLRNEDFFNVEQYPQICFVSERISKTQDGYEVTGALTLHGVTKTVTIPFTHESSVFTGKIKIKRLDYDLGKGTGGFLVGKKVNIEIVAELK